MELIRGHELHELYAALPEDIRSEVQKSYPGKLDDDIATMSRAFVTWQYEHEHEGLSINPNALASIGIACHRVVCKRRPDLKVFGENHAIALP